MSKKTRLKRLREASVPTHVSGIPEHAVTYRTPAGPSGWSTTFFCWGCIDPAMEHFGCKLVDHSRETPEPRPLIGTYSVPNRHLASQGDCTPPT